MRHNAYIKGLVMNGSIPLRDVPSLETFRVTMINAAFLELDHEKW